MEQKLNKLYIECVQELEKIGIKVIDNKEISPWVMELNEDIIKNTIMHELIHCMPGCSNHGEYFKKYDYYVNAKLGYDISRVRK